MNTSGERTLKIEAIGDFARRRIKPRIRLSGQWLDRAGFKPGNRVQVRMGGPGELTLRFMAEPAPVQVMGAEEAHADPAVPW